jgi:chromosome partitioning protein
MAESTIVSIINHKGGVGKTSTVVNLAAGLSKLGKSVLVVDLDTQMNLTHSLIGDLPEDAPSISEVMIKNPLTITSIIQKTNVPNVDIAPSGESMVNLELELHSAIDRERRLKRALTMPELQKYEYILIDNAPHVGLATINSLMASQYYLVPVSAEYLPLVGLKHLIRTIDQIKPYHTEIQNVGYLLTMVDRREGISTVVERLLRETFQHEVFESIVRINTKIKSCPQRKETIFDVEGSKGKGQEDYLNVAKEFLQRVEASYGYRS